MRAASSFTPLEPGDITCDASAKVVAVIVTHNRPQLLRNSLSVVSEQSRPVDHVIVVDNACQDDVKTMVEGLSVDSTYLGSQLNLGGAGGFALGMLHALSLGADWVWCADDDGKPVDEHVLATLLASADTHQLAQVSPVVCDIDNPENLAFPLRSGLSWRRTRGELAESNESVVWGICSLFNGALISSHAFTRIGVPDLRLFIRGDEVEMHRRLHRSGLPFGTCLHTAYVHPNGSNEFKPILGGKMHAQDPADDVKRHFTYRNRGYLLNQPGYRKLLPQEWARFGWYFLVNQQDISGLRNWMRLHRLGREEKFTRPNS